MKTISIPKLETRASIVPNSFNEKENTIEVLASSGAQVRREPWFSEPFIEELEISKKAIVLDRFLNGAPVLKDHDNSTIDSQIGVVEGARIEGKNLFATVRLSKREDFKPIVDDIKDNIIRNVSVG